MKAFLLLVAICLVAGAEGQSNCLVTGSYNDTTGVVTVTINSTQVFSTHTNRGNGQPGNSNNVLNGNQYYLFIVNQPNCQVYNWSSASNGQPNSIPANQVLTNLEYLRDGAAVIAISASNNLVGDLVPAILPVGICATVGTPIPNSANTQHNPPTQANVAVIIKGFPEETTYIPMIGGSSISGSITIAAPASCPNGATIDEIQHLLESEFNAVQNIVGGIVNGVVTFVGGIVQQFGLSDEINQLLSAVGSIG